MPIILAVVLIIGAFLTGGALQERVQQPQPPTPTPVQEVQVATPSPTFTPTLTPKPAVKGVDVKSPKPKPPTPTEFVDTVKQEKILELVKKIAERYVALGSYVKEANNTWGELVKCSTTVREEALAQYSKPQTVTIGKGTPYETTSTDILYSPDQIRSLVNQKVSGCINIQQTKYEIAVNSIGYTEKEIKELKNQLQDIAVNCSSCISLYQTALKGFDELDAKIKFSIKYQE